MELTVVKVGGGLLGSPADLDRVVAALVQRRRRGERLLVVVSAFKGVTDALEQAASEALDPRSGGEMVRDLLAWLRRAHVSMLAGRPERHVAPLHLGAALDGVERLLTGVRLTGELTDRTAAMLLAHGERLAAPLVAEALRAAGADARAVTAEEAGLVASGPYRFGSCDLPASLERLSRLRHELHDRILVLTGFYGMDSRGEVVLFGRGGSDYSAGVVAAGLDAAALELWKDVPGFLSADPRDVPTARVVPELSFDEACELGYYGARILHPRCLEPLRGRPTRINLCPVSVQPGGGTAIVERRRGGPAVVALARRRGVAWVRVHGTAMVNCPGVAGRVLSAVGEAGVDVDALAASMTSLSFTVEESQATLVRRTLRLLQEDGALGVEQLSVQGGVALLGVVGDGVAADPRIAAAALTTLAELGLSLDLVCHGPGDVGLSCVVPETELAGALGALHACFFPAGVEEEAWR